ncbi:MAG: DUF975 family protein [Butyricicoccus pullicaecorum]|nr:DUF975 family protein [Butyricicoccus pullicaecorum]
MDQDTIKLNAGERRKIKAIAKVRIMMRLPLCAAAVAMYMLPAMLIGLMTGVSADANLERMALMFGLGIFCEVVLLGPIMMGMQYFCVAAARGQNTGLSIILSPLSNLRECLRGVRMMLCLMFRMLLLAILPTLLYFGAVYVTSGWIEQQGIEDMQIVMNLLAGLITLYLLLLLPLMGRMAAYVMGYGLLYDNPEMGVWRATREAGRLLRGQRRGMLAFTLSFLPWWVCGFFTCGLTVMFGMVYASVSLHVLGDRLRGISSLNDQELFPKL